MANASLGCKSGCRNNQVRLCQVFDLAQTLGAGVREGAPAQPGHGRGRPNRGQTTLQLRLTPGGMAPEMQNRLRVIVSSLPPDSEQPEEASDSSAIPRFAGA